MASHEAVRKATHETVVGRPFTRIPGEPTWEQKENFLRESTDLSLEFTVSYNWAGGHGLLAYVCIKSR